MTSDWIPVDQRLPDKYRKDGHLNEVLIVTKNGTQAVAYYETDENIGWHWSSYCEYDLINDSHPNNTINTENPVTHWMALPESPIT